jgi:hypothetical protein
LKWIEPAPNQNDPSKFIAVFEDGTIHIYHKDVTYDNKIDLDKEYISI